MRLLRVLTLWQLQAPFSEHHVLQQGEKQPRMIASPNPPRRMQQVAGPSSRLKEIPAVNIATRKEDLAHKSQKVIHGQERKIEADRVGLSFPHCMINI